ncbi:MAG: DUF2207 domain-containing protein, partial [Candidatus Micrarchaeota archaeon]
NVTENLTFNFHGEYYYAYREIPLIAPDGRIIQISNTAVYEGETKLQRDLSMENGTEKVLWWFSAKDEEKTFTLKYTVKNQVVRYFDVADLTWVVYDGDWWATADSVRVLVRMPKEVSDGEVLAWSHWPQWRSIDAKNGVVEFFTKNVPPKNSIDVRVVFPSSAINGTLAASAQGQALDRITAEEKARFDKERNEFLITELFPYVPLVFPVLLLASIGILWLIYGRPHKVGFEQKYFHEPPYDYSPAMLGVLMDDVKKKPDWNAFVATILDLSQKKYIKMERTAEKTGATDIRLTLAKDPDEKLKDYEVAALYCLFGRRDVFAIAMEKPGVFNKVVGAFQDAPKEKKLDLPEKTITLGELTQNSKIKASFFASFERWQDSSKNAGRKLMFHEERAGVIAKWFSITAGSLLVVIVPLFLSLAAYIDPQDVQKTFVLITNVFLAFLAGLGITIHGNRALQKRTPKGALHYEKWLAFKRFVSDATLLKQYPPESIAIWDRYLIYATALGCANNVAGTMRAEIKPTKGDEDYAWLESLGGGGANEPDWLNVMGDAFEAILRSAR